MVPYGLSTDTYTYLDGPYGLPTDKYTYLDGPLWTTYR